MTPQAFAKTMKFDVRPVPIYACLWATLLAIAMSVPRSPVHAAEERTSAPMTSAGPVFRVPPGQSFRLSLHASFPPLWIGNSTNSIFANTKQALVFTASTLPTGGVVLVSDAGKLSVSSSGIVSLRLGRRTDAEKLQWTRNRRGGVVIRSWASKGYLRVEPGTGALYADGSTKPLTDKPPATPFDIVFITKTGTGER
jgi:hypothetical protein